ncbi:MAG: hypothetical protein JWP32_1877 [Schumannella sp.]|nr:hypothetical protein [Schumannella sp.]
MNQREIFLLSDAALREVIDGITPEQLDLPAPGDWSRKPDPQLRHIVTGHAYDEAWVPDVIAGKTIEEVGDRYKPVLKSDDPVAEYDRVHDLATAAVDRELDLTQTVHLSYGDFPMSVFFEHTSYFRAFQAWSIGRFLGNDVRLPDALVAGLTELVTPQLEQLRQIHVFGPEVEVPADADAQTRLLGLTGFWA